MKYLYLIACLGLCALSSIAQNVKQAFNPIFTNEGPRIRIGATYPDGRILIAGDLSSADNKPLNGIARLLPDGRIDESFQASKGPSGKIYDIEILPDGKLLVAGHFNAFHGELINNLVRLKSDGSIDDGFQVGRMLTPDGSINSIDIQPDGRVLLAGAFRFANETEHTYVSRLLPNGAIDDTFKFSKVPDFYIDKVLAQHNGKILTLGYYGIRRFNADGSPDATFNISYKIRVGMKDMALQQVNGEERLLIGGSFTSFDNVPAGCLIRITLDGMLDHSFNAGNTYYNFQSDYFNATISRILVTGNDVFTINSKGIFKHNVNGIKDDSFNATSYGTKVRWLAANTEGNLFCHGADMGFSGAKKYDLVKTSASGTLIEGFKPALTHAGVITAVVKDGNKFIVAGIFDHVNHMPFRGLVRLDETGAVDPALQLDPHMKGNISSLVLLPDKKLIAAGTLVLGGAPYYLARLKEDGTADFSMPINSNVPSTTPVKIIAQPDGKIIAASTAWGIRRFTQAGAFDPSFDPDNTLHGQIVEDFTVQEDGKILVASRNAGTIPADITSTISSFLPNGTVSNPALLSTPGILQNLTILNDSLYISLVENLRETVSAHVYRINSAGRIDKSNSISVFGEYGYNGTTSDVNLHPDKIRMNKKLLVAGTFDMVIKVIGQGPLAEVQKKNVALFDNKGNYEPGFTIDLADGPAPVIVPINDTEFIIGGSFATVNGTPRTGLAWMQMPSELPAAPSQGVSLIENGEVKITWVDNATNESGFEIQRLNNYWGQYYPLTIIAANSSSYVDLAGEIGKGNYTYRIRSTNAAGSSAFVEIPTLVTDTEAENSMPTSIAYPNPTRGALSLTIEPAGQRTVGIADITGRAIPFTWIDSHQIDVSGASPGIYILSIQTHGGLVRQKFVKEN